MMEDFYIGAGSKIRPSEEEMEQFWQEYESSWKAALESTVSEGAKQALEELKGADALLKAGDSDGVRALLARPIILTMGLKIAPKPKQPIDGPWAKCEKEGGACKEALSDARRSFQEVEEWCFSNRVEFFNSADQKQVLALGNGKGVEDRMQQIKASIDEPLDALNNGRDALRQLIAKA